MKLNNIKQQFLSSRNNLIIHNRYVLYIILFISLANLYYLAISHDYFSVVIFFLIGFLTTFFSKNMIIIMFFALVFTFIIKNSNNPSLEGLKTKQDDDTEESTEDSDTKKDSKKEKEVDSKDAKKDSKKESSTKKTTTKSKKTEDDTTDEIADDTYKTASESKSQKKTQENLVGSEYSSNDMNASDVIDKIKKIVEVLQT